LQIITLELDQHFKDLATPYFEKAGVNSKIDVRVGSAIDLIEDMVKSKEEPFDVIFIDADKTGYKKYYDTIMDAGLLCKGGVMLVDNVLYKVWKCFARVRRAHR
jgi:caffeoyl-CoA O-methyltransferase